MFLQLVLGDSQTDHVSAPFQRDQHFALSGKELGGSKNMDRWGSLGVNFRNTDLRNKSWGKRCAWKVHENQLSEAQGGAIKAELP